MRTRFVAPFQANLHLLRLLGDELIGSVPLAVFELVKNAYDADASEASIKLDLDAEVPFISVEDNGCGMGLGTIRSAWLQIGTPAKRGVNRVRTKKNRMPLGEKGVGRLAAFKLGSRITVVTRAKGADEYQFSVDLGALLDGVTDYRNSTAQIQDVRVDITRNISPKHFGEGRTGTVIRISKLNDIDKWNRREIRRLNRLVTSLKSPFQKSDKFDVTLEVPGREGFLKDMLALEDILGRAIWTFNFTIDGNADFRWEYSFSPPPIYRTLRANAMSGEGSGPGSGYLALLLGRGEEFPDRPGRPPAAKDKILLKPEGLMGIGPLKGRFYVFDRRPDLLRQLGESTQMKQFLEEQAGVRVYRDDVRVYNYGEPGDDWLGLNVARVNKPGRRLANNAVVASIGLDLECSSELQEKTNREGFDENSAFLRFRRIVDSVVDFLNRIRQEDRDKLDAAIKGDSSPTGPEKFADAIVGIRSLAKKHGIQNSVAPYISRIEKEYNDLREVALSTGAGMNLAVIFHEVQRGVQGLRHGIENNRGIEELKAHAKSLSDLLEGFNALFRKDSKRTAQVTRLLERAKVLNEGRFRAHGIVFSCPVLTGEDVDFSVSGSLNFYLAALSNLFDNAIYWLRHKRESQGGAFIPAITVRTLTDWAAEGPAIAVIDNGPGFNIAPEEAVKPFKSTRPGGIGIGLYFVQMVMEMNGGQLIITSAKDLDLDIPHDGAAVVLLFKR